MHRKAKHPQVIAKKKALLAENNSEIYFILKVRDINYRRSRECAEELQVIAACNYECDVKISLGLLEKYLQCEQTVETSALCNMIQMNLNATSVRLSET